MNDIAVNQDNKAEITAYILLILTAFGWGMSTIIVKSSVGQIGLAHLLMARSAIGALVIFLAAPRKILDMTRRELKTGLILGITLSFGYYFGIFCLQYTSASKAGFLMSLNVLFVPLAEVFLKRRLPSRWLVASVLLSMAGLLLISGMNGGGFNFGDGLAAIGALMYSVYVIQLDRLGPGCDDYVISFLQVVVLFFVGLAGAAGFEGLDLSSLSQNMAPLLVLGIFGTGLTTLFQTKAQKTASPESVGIILLADPLFCLILAALVLHETILISGVAGSFLILAALVMAILKRV